MTTTNIPMTTPRIARRKKREAHGNTDMDDLEGAIEEALLLFSEDNACKKAIKINK
jgi:hypothetical protein